MSTKKATAEKPQGLVFDQSQDKLFEVWGVPQNIAEKIGSRYELFEDETRDDICSRLEAELPEGLIEAFKNDEGFENLTKKQVEEKIEETVGMAVTKSGALQLFLDSQLFQGIGWTPKTPNDFFVLGWVIGNYYANEKLKKSLGGLVDILKKAVKH